MVIVLLAVNEQTGELLYGPDLVSRGFVFPRAAKPHPGGCEGALCWKCWMRSRDLPVWTGGRSVPEIKKGLKHFFYEDHREAAAGASDHFCRFKIFVGKDFRASCEEAERANRRKYRMSNVQFRREELPWNRLRNSTFLVRYSIFPWKFCCGRRPAIGKSWARSLKTTSKHTGISEPIRKEIRGSFSCFVAIFLAGSSLLLQSHDPVLGIKDGACGNDLQPSSVPWEHTSRGWIFLVFGFSSFLARGRLPVHGLSILSRCPGPGPARKAGFRCSSSWPRFPRSPVFTSRV